MDGFLGKKLYAGKAAKRFMMKLAGLLWRECSIWQRFFNSPFMVSMIDRFLSSILSLTLINRFFMFFFIPVKKMNALV
jgi:hypothetical protein